MLSLGRTRAFSFALLAVCLGGCDDPVREPAGDGSSSSTTGTGSVSETAEPESSTGTGATTLAVTTDAESGEDGSSSTSGPSSETDSGSSTGADASESSSSEGSSSSSTGADMGDVDTVCEAGERETVCELPSPYEAAGDCDPYAQDCAEGEKCVPWASDGSTAWNSTRCSPVPAEPAQLGETCTVEGSGVSGVDSCDVGLMCWDADVETLVGTCIELCGCGPVAPTCEGGGTQCTISNQDSLPLCLPTCDPLDPAAVCGDGEGCYPAGDGFQCAPDASGDEGMVAQPCSFINGCEPGLACVAPETVLGCAGNGCCTPFCDLDEPDSCPFGSCQPWFPEGEEPLECHVDTGVCAL